MCTRGGCRLVTRAEANGICAAIFRGLVQATVFEGFGSIQSEAVTRVGRVRGLEEVTDGSTETAASTRQDSVGRFLAVGRTTVLAGLVLRCRDRRRGELNARDAPAARKTRCGREQTDGEKEDAHTLVLARNRSHARPPPYFQK